MQWFNEPENWTDKEGVITVTTGAKTDFWRKTHENFIKDDGHFYYQKQSDDFTASVKITGKYVDLYDQAGIMIRIDEENWIKCGIELLHGVQQASAVVTRDFSDWSVVPLPQNPEQIWLTVKRKGNSIEVLYSLDNETWTMIRTAYFPVVDNLDVGLMCASPQGDGFSVQFEDFIIQPLS